MPEIDFGHDDIRLGIYLIDRYRLLSRYSRVVLAGIQCSHRVTVLIMNNSDVAARQVTLGMTACDESIKYINSSSSDFLVEDPQSNTGIPIRHF